MYYDGKTNRKGIINKNRQQIWISSSANEIAEGKVTVC